MCEESTKSIVASYTFVLMCGFISGGMLLAHLKDESWKRDIIKQGLGEYNAKTSVFQLKSQTNESQ